MATLLLVQPEAQLDPGYQLDPGFQVSPGFQIDPGGQIDPGTVVLAQIDPGTIALNAQIDPYLGRLTRSRLNLAA